MLKYLPATIRRSLLRRKMSLSQDLPYIVKIADNQEEISQVLELLRSEYGKGFCHHHLLPTTSILVLKKKSEVVGTLSLFYDGSLGLPIDECRQLKDLRSKGHKLLQVSHLALKTKDEDEKLSCFLLLQKYVHEYAISYLKVDTILAQTKEGLKDHYRGLLLYRSLDGDVFHRYDVEKGTRYIYHVLPLRNYNGVLERTYGQASRKSNLHHYFCHKSLDQLQYPEKPFFSISDSVMSPETLKWILNEEDHLLSALSLKDRSTISQMYHYPNYTALLETDKLCEDFKDRRHLRIMVSCPSALLGDTSVVAVLVDEVSRSGFKIKGQKLSRGQNVSVRVKLGVECFTWIEAKVVWVAEDELTAGLEIIRHSETWEHFIENLEAPYRLQAA